MEPPPAGPPWRPSDPQPAPWFQHGRRRVIRPDGLRSGWRDVLGDGGGGISFSNWPPRRSAKLIHRPRMLEWQSPHQTNAAANEVTNTTGEATPRVSAALRKRRMTTRMKTGTAVTMIPITEVGPGHYSSQWQAPIWLAPEATSSRFFS